MNFFEQIFTNDTLYFDCLDRLPEAIYVYNVKKELVYLNKAAEHLDGFTLKEAKGKTIYELYDFVHGLDENYSPTLISLRTEKPVYNHELSYIADGKQIVQICNSAPIYDNGKLVGVYVIQQDMTAIKDIVEKNISLQREIGSKNSATGGGEQREDAFSLLIGDSPAFIKAKELARQVAETDSSVMLIGSTGSGKEVFAKAIHQHSRRKYNSFLALNCAAIPESLVEGILFGTVKGVYTGAIEKEGLLAQADGGTVFLDEINSMPLATQAKLLRVLDEKKIMKLGSNKEKEINVRIISSTNESIEDAIANSHIREDLFYRLSVVQILIPCLHQRKEDIPTLTNYFIRCYNRRFQKNVIGVTDEVLSCFMNFLWPGNVRQLKACIESAMNFVPSNKEICLGDLPPYLFDTGKPSTDRHHRWQQVRYSQGLPGHSPTTGALEEDKSLATPKELKQQAEKDEREKIQAALSQSKGNISQAAQNLGISKQLLFYRLKKYNLR